MTKPSGSENLAVLLAQTALGDRRAFAELYTRTNAKLFGVIIRILGRQDVAEDVLQDCFVVIWQRAGDYNSAIASPISWMATIARNKAIDKKRSSGERLSQNAVPVDEEIASMLATPLDEAERSERLTSLTYCLERLPPDRRQMVLLAYLYGCSRDEIAARFSRPIPTVKTILRRALENLKGCLDGRA